MSQNDVGNFEVDDDIDPLVNVEPITNGIEQETDDTHNPVKLDTTDKRNKENLIFFVNRYLKDVEDKLLARRISFEEGRFGSSRTRFVLNIACYVLGITLEDLGQGHEKKELISLLAALAEIDMTIMYHENHIRDQKFRVSRKDIESVWNKKLEKQRLKYTRDAFLNSSFDYEHLEYIRVSNSLMHQVHDLIGMFLDKNLTTIESFKRGSYPVEEIRTKISNLNSYSSYIEIFKAGRKLNNEDDIIFFDAKKVYEELAANTRGSDNRKIIYKDRYSNYMKLYLSRCFLLNIIFYYCYTELIIKLLGKEGERFDELVEFATYYGLMQQIVNDNSDYVPVDEGYFTTAKLTEDTFSDIRERNITLPIVFYLAKKIQETEGIPEDDKLIKYYLTNKSNELLSDNETQEEILDILLVSESLQHAMSISASVSKVCGNILNPNNNNRSELEKLLTSALENRYYKYYVGRLKELTNSKY